MKVTRLVVAIAVTAMLLTLFTPRRAAADFSQGLLIGAAIAGGVVVISAVVALIATAGASDEPHFLTEPMPGSLQKDPYRKPGNVRFGLQCPVTAEGPAVVCW